MNYQHKSSRSLRLLRLKAAFTLVELMVVLAIIAGLLLLIVPNVRKQRARARSTQCQNNLRQFGVAMNQYMAANEGYFVYPGTAKASGFGKGYSHNIDISEIPDGVVASGGSVISLTGKGSHNWQSLVAYIPDSSVTNVDFIRSGQSSVRICPGANCNVFDPKHDDFKGRHTYQDDAVPGDIVVPDFMSKFTSDAKKDLILSSSFTTYAINTTYMKKSRDMIPSQAIAFIDANVEESWGYIPRKGFSYLSNTEGKWMFTGRDKDGNPVEQGDSKMELKGTTNWWHTEIGFYHPGIGTNMTANYVAMDGSVGSISYADISVTNFTGLE